MKENQFDVIVIGAGPGGYETALEAAEHQLKVAIVEKDQLGGTCLNVGCIPTKCLCKNAEVLEEVKAAERFGIGVSGIDFNISAAIDRKNEVVGKLIAGVEALMKHPNITLFRGKAFLGNVSQEDAALREVRIAATQEGGEEVVIAGKYIVIATGSETKYLPIEGAKGDKVVSSTELLDTREVPKRLCVIGGGVIGLEFASIFNTFGSEVTVIEFCKEILPFFDRDIAKRLRTSLKKKGIVFKTGSAVKEVSDAEGEKLVSFEEKGKISTIAADLVLMAVGRGAALGSLNLDEVGIKYTRRGITVDENLRTNIAGIYAIGDINGLMQLAHAATFQGKVALRDILEKEGKTPENKPQIHLDLCPAAVFTVPELAMVGKTEEQLEEEGKEYKVAKSFYRANGKALAMDAEDGYVKILFDAEGKILGAHILGAHASDLIHETTVLMNMGGTIQQLRTTIHAHPTLSEIILNAK